jgi:hypothetical protein
MFHLFKVMKSISNTLNELLQGVPIKLDVNRAGLKEL